jgi:hypothetical protein
MLYGIVCKQYQCVLSFVVIDGKERANILVSLKVGDGMLVHYDSIVLDIADCWRSL